MEELLKILKSVKPGVDFEKEDNLIEDEVLTSFDIVSLITKLNDEFDIEITAADIVPENFESASTILKLVEKLENE